MQPTRYQLTQEQLLKSFKTACQTPVPIEELFPGNSGAPHHADVVPLRKRETPKTPPRTPAPPPPRPPGQRMPLAATAQAATLDALLAKVAKTEITQGSEGDRFRRMVRL